MRLEALAELEKPAYDPELMAIDKEFVLKKLGFTEREWDALMRQPPTPHSAFASDDRLVRSLLAVNHGLKRVARVLHG